MATTYKDISDAIMARIEANWTATAIDWPNTTFTPPAAAWIQPRIVWGDAVQATLGEDGLNRITGNLHVNVFAPRGAGPDEAAQYVDSFRNLFPRGLRLSASGRGLIFHTPRAVAPIEDEEWYQVPVVAPFYLDEIP